MSTYRIATKEQVKAKVRAMEKHEAQKQAWMTKFSKQLSSSKTLRKSMLTSWAKQ